MTTSSSAPALPLTDHTEAVLRLSGDPALADLIARVGALPVLSPTPDPFGTLVRSVAGQQLSVKAAASIYARLVGRLGEVTPGTLLTAPPEDLRALGLSWAKVRTVRALAEAALDGRVDFAHLEALPDEAVLERLTPLPGIGRWTVEMFLMFGLARPDVFSFGDLVLRQELERLHPGALTRTEQNEVVRAWSPHRTLASRYLWAEKTRRRLSAGAGTVTGDLTLTDPL
ncbi:DNA-3-methyladenine glycosylase family protein [Deinococcus planocerae]|uniref:DNA-3-methyladenine glycosylase family protein n=1 Tax=Deinococcus planocerae TaxID=1737569 RepID=UPI000C7EC0C3|nr:DNA-3-methyladenine glycosylase [Deinococcus planocerae]